MKTQKRCIKCLIIKGIIEFDTYNRKKYGKICTQVHSMCKECRQYHKKTLECDQIFIKMIKSQIATTENKIRLLQELLKLYEE